MLEGYNIAKKITIDGRNLRIYFRDNQSPPVFVFSDVLTITFKEYGRIVANFIGKIPEEHKEKIFYNHCEHWVLDFEGMAEFIRAFSEDPEITLSQIKTFIDDVYKGDLPSPVVVIKNHTDSKVISVKGIQYEYKISKGVRWFKAEPFNKAYNIRIRHSLRLPNKDRDIPDDWISEDDLMDALQVFETDKALQIYDSVIEACNHNEIIDKPWQIDDMSPMSFVIDGDKSDSTRYLFKTTNIRGRKLTIVYVILDSGVILLFYDIKLLATLLNIDPEAAAHAAISHCSCFFKDDNVYTNIVGVNSVLQKFAYNKDAAHSLTRKVCKNLYGTKETIPLKLEGKLIYTTRDTVEIQEVKHSMKPVPFSDGEFTAVDVAQISVNNGTITVVLAKRTEEIFNPSAEIIPMFRVYEVDSVFNINNWSALTKKIPAEERHKVSLPELKKNNVVIVTESGLKTFLCNAKEPKEAADILNTIVAAVIKYIRDNKETINFTLSYWSKKEESAGIPVRGEKKTILYFEHHNNPVDILVTKQDDKQIYYISVDSLNKLPDIQIPSGDYIDQDGNRYISVKDWADFVARQTDTTNFSEETVNEAIRLQLSADTSSKETAQKAVKDTAFEEKTSGAPSLDVKTFVLSAVTLAENLRGMLTYYKTKKLKTARLPGPSTISIINELWKYIQCQELNGNVPLGFEKMVQAGILRLEHLLKVVESQKG